MTTTAPIAALSTRAKVTNLAGGVVAGFAMGAGASYALPSSEGERRLEKQGISTMSDLEARATFAPLLMFGAAAIGTGIGKRSGSAALTTASLGAAMMLASPASSAIRDSESADADKALRSMGVLGAIAGAGFATGAIERVPLNVAKGAGLVSIGLAAGMLLPETARYVAGMPGDLGRGFKHRDE